MYLIAQNKKTFVEADFLAVEDSNLYTIKNGVKTYVAQCKTPQEAEELLNIICHKLPYVMGKQLVDFYELTHKLGEINEKSAL